MVLRVGQVLGGLAVVDRPVAERLVDEARGDEARVVEKDHPPHAVRREPGRQRRGQKAPEGVAAEEEGLGKALRRHQVQEAVQVLLEGEVHVRLGGVPEPQQVREDHAHGAVAPAQAQAKIVVRRQNPVEHEEAAGLAREGSEG